MAYFGLYRWGIIIVLLLTFENYGIESQEQSNVDFEAPQGEDECTPEGCRLAREAVYFITSPSHVTPHMLYQMSVSLLKMYYRKVVVTASIRRNEAEEIASCQHTFNKEGTTMMQMQIPENAQPGEYSLRVEGTEEGLSGGYLFDNQTELIFDAKWLSVMIHVNKPAFMQDQTVKFRVMPVKRNLFSHSGTMDVYILDALNNIVKRWPSMQTNIGGVLDMEYQLTEQPKYGIWNIRVDAFGHQYFKEFEVQEYYFSALDVNVSAPIYHMADEFAIAGTVMANMSMGLPVHGTYKMSAQIRPPLAEQHLEDPETWPVVEHETRHFHGRSDFMFTMEELKNAAGLDSMAGREVYIEALIKEWFRLEESAGWTLTVVHADEVKIKVLGDPSRTFKPLRQMDLRFALYHPDGLPLDRQRRQVTIMRTARRSQGGTEGFEDRIITDDDGICRYSFIPGEFDEFQTITASYDSGFADTAVAEVRAHRYFSPTNNFIYITSHQETPAVDKYMVFTITTTVYTPTIHYVVLAGGSIITGNTIDMKSTQTTFSLALSRDMIPQAHLLVWYIYKGEVITDDINFFVNGTRLNPIDVQFSRGKDFSGETIETIIFSDPSSYVGTSVIDYELLVYGWSSFITEADLIRELETFEYHMNKSDQHTFMTQDREERMIHFPAHSYGIDANTTFEYSGLVVFTDAQVTRLYHNCNETIGFFPCMDGMNCYTQDQWCDGVSQCEDMRDEMGCPVEDDYMYTPTKYRLEFLTRHYVEDGSWLWQGTYVMPNGRLDITVEVPDEPMTWVLGGFGISRELGFGIIHNQPRHESTRMFFMRAEVPDTVVRGEQIGVRLALFNLWEDYLECLVTLYDSEAFRSIIVEDHGIVNSYNPRTKRGDVQTMVYLEMKKAYEIQIPILPVVEGCFTVTVSAATILFNDMETMEICIMYDGVTNVYNTPYFVDLVNSGSMELPDFDIVVPEQFFKTGSPFHLYVPGSPTSKLGVVGDIVGPGFIEDFLNTENTLRKPYGAAEQVMYNFAYNLYMIIYLKETNQLKDHVLHRTLAHLDVALQRQMSYMNDDGSFSMFRDYLDHTPTIWGTAFVLRVFNDGNQREWENYFYIADTVISKIVNWLCKQQNPDGTWTEKAPLYDRKLWTKEVLDGNGNPKRIEDIGMTAYVLIALNGADQLTSEAQACRSLALNQGRDWLNNVVFNNTITDPYQLALVTYALQVTAGSEARNCYEQLKKIKFKTNFVYWADKEIPPNEVNYVDIYSHYQPRVYYDNEAYAVEATSYAMLIHMRYRDFRDVPYMMRFLQSMRNTFSAQASSQDSIVALKALTTLAQADTNRWLYNIRFNIRATAHNEDFPEVDFNNQNWQDAEFFQISPVWGSVRGQVLGSGIALVQMETTMNVEYYDEIAPQALERYFDVIVHVRDEPHSRNSSIIRMEPCARWVRPDISNISGLAVIEMDLPTGYALTDDIFRNMAQAEEIPRFRRGHLKGRRISLFFDYLDQEWSCVNFRVDRWYPVANMTIQHMIKVYDYYEPGMFNQSLYETYTLFHLHICQVCGSFQCPYCPFYNLAPTIEQRGLLIAVIVGVIAMIVSSIITSTNHRLFV